MLPMANSVFPCAGKKIDWPLSIRAVLLFKVIGNTLLEATGHSIGKMHTLGEHLGITIK